MWSPAIIPTFIMVAFYQTDPTGVQGMIIVCCLCIIPPHPPLALVRLDLQGGVIFLIPCCKYASAAVFAINQTVIVGLSPTNPPHPLLGVSVGRRVVFLCLNAQSPMSLYQSHLAFSKSLLFQVMAGVLSKLLNCHRFALWSGREFAAA